MSKIKQMATLTIINFTDGKVEAVITSHPDGNDLEELCKKLIELTNALIKAEPAP